MSKINIYVCKNGHETITRDTEPRTTTPMFISCQECIHKRHVKERAASSNYMVDQSLTPHLQWFKPKTISEMLDALRQTQLPEEVEYFENNPKYLDDMLKNENCFFLKKYQEGAK
jgi:DNA-directed RNA polymerase subunit RPC12/RpoP